MGWKNDFLSNGESELSKEFLENGYLLLAVEDPRLLEKIRNMLIQIVVELAGDKTTSTKNYLDNIHKRIQPESLNDLRVKLINHLNALNWLRESYFRLARTVLETIVGNELAMQLRINLSIQMPHDDSSLLPVHSDVWSGDSPFEVVVWLPLVDCYRTKSMFLLPPAPTRKFHDNFHEFKMKNSEELFRAIEPELKWIDISYGQVLLFNQNLPHGNRVNNESETRWSMNCRFKSIFSPYGDKKLGEFFEPITLRAASRLGMSYSFPGEDKWEIT